MLCGCKGKPNNWICQTFYTIFRILVLIPCTDKATIEGCIVFEKRTTGSAIGYNTIVNIVGAIAFGTV